MVVYTCDGCGREMSERALRYTVTVDVRAVYEKTRIGLLELVQDHRKELIALIDRLKGKSAHEIEETIHKEFKLDLCPSCQRAYIRGPLHFHPEQGEPRDEVNIESFLRSLGYGASSQEDDE